MDLDRWTRFAQKGGIGKCVALRDCVAKQPDDLMFFKDDEITVLMQVSEEDGTYVGYCEGVIGRFAAAHVHFTGKLKTPVMVAKRSSTSKSPRPSSSTPSRRQQPSQSPVPSPSRPSSREGVSSPHAHSSPSASVPSPLPIRHRHSFSETSPRLDVFVGSSHPELLHMSSISYSSSSSAHESASPPTPSEYHAEPQLKDKSRPFVVSNTSHSNENRRTSLCDNTHSPDIARATSQASETPPSVPPHGPRPLSPSKVESPHPRLGVDDTCTTRFSRPSSATSDGAADIGLSMLQGFPIGNVEDREDDDKDGDGSDLECSSQSERERTSLEETVDGFPAPPTQIPTPSSRATSFVLEACRPRSTISDYSEDGDGASFYDNYRYSRLSMSSRVSKSSGYTVATVPPPIPIELPPPVRHSQDSQYLASTPFSSPSETSSVSSPVGEATSPMRMQTTMPPPPTVGNGPLALELSNLETAVATSPLLHTNFSSPQSSPPDPHTSTARSPTGAAFDFQGRGAASALRQMIELDRGISSPLTSPLTSTTSNERTFELSQSIVVEDIERDAVTLGMQPHSPTSNTSSVTSEKKKRGGPAPLIVMNPTPPPPYTPLSPEEPCPSPALTATLAPAISHPSGGPIANQAANTSSNSVFPPHPNAPKPNLSPQGRLYGRVMPPAQPLPSTSLIQMMHKAVQTRVEQNGLPRISTIYGSTTQGLSAAAGPVPIYFTVDPPNDKPANQMRRAPAPTLTPTPVPISTQDTLSSTSDAPQLSALADGVTSNVIPRANFVPKVGAVRPRSRSFSGFDSPMGPGIQPKERSREETDARPPTADQAPSSRLNPMAARAAAHTARIHQPRQYTPSPLALSQTTATPSTSPLAGDISVSTALPSSSQTSPTPHRTLTPVKSEPSLRPGVPRSTQEHEAAPRPSAKLETGVSSRVPLPSQSTALKNAPPSIRISASESQALPSRTVPVPRNETPLSQQLSTGSLQRKPSLDVQGSSHADPLTQVSSPPPASAPGASFGRSGSLRSKISLSALRAKSSRDDDGLHESTTVQIKDTDFELVRPNLARPRLSEDSSANGKSSGSEGRPSFLRLDSPAMSMTSGGASDTRSPVSPSGMSLPPVGVTPTAASVGAVEAHRARELKWISAMSSTPSSHARKSKKIRKLLQEGVPASVRYQVWAHLTDSRAKRIEGLYVQLGEREKVPAFAEIQRDAQLCFPSDARLSQPNGPLVSLLQSYLTMVPDVQYCNGLVFIAGQLLLQSPEEDAFWIFISLMDSHLRPYFASNAIQLDIDASLFAKALEMIDPTIAKKLFVDMYIDPTRICKPWFSSLLVEALPSDYFQRVWDIFLSEGMVFLLRVGLAIVICCHRTLLGVHQKTEALDILTHPPLFLISSSPDLFIELANSFKLKDDEIRKQRVKRQMQAKAQTQSRLSNAARRSSSNINGNGRASTSISLSRN